MVGVRDRVMVSLSDTCCFRFVFPFWLVYANYWGHVSVQVLVRTDTGSQLTVSYIGWISCSRMIWFLENCQFSVGQCYSIVRFQNNMTEHHAYHAANIKGEFHCFNHLLVDSQAMSYYMLLKCEIPVKRFLQS